VTGIVENMSGFVCPKCGEVSEIFKSGGGASLAEESGAPFLGKVPIDPRIVDSADEGRPYVSAFPESPAAEAFAGIVERIRHTLDPQSK
jgi:MinD superfamily P-loop ATPase